MGFFRAVFLAVAVCVLAQPRSLAEGVLCVHPDNPRYFLGIDGKPLYLGGHQWFNDVQHNAWNTAITVDWDAYLAYMNERGMNYFRSWVIWSTGFPEDQEPRPIMPFKRMGPGTALDGLPKFDLTQFDPVFFERIHDEMKRAEAAGVYASIMLFEVYGFMGPQPDFPDSFWAGNVFHGPNNINEIDTDTNGDGHGLEFFFTKDDQLRRIQRDYVAKMLEAVNDCGNVFFEIANELEAPDWQAEMIRFIHEREQALPNQHLVYLSPGGRDALGKWKRLPREVYLDSEAEVCSVTRWQKDYRGNPPVQPPKKPVFMDMDHIAATDNFGDNDWNNRPATAWKLFTRGYHQCIYDQDYWKPEDNRDAWDATRRAIGATVKLARQLDLVRLQPLPDLANTGYCLADPGRSYVVFQPGGETITVQGLHKGAAYTLRWLHMNGREAGKETVTAGAEKTNFTPPFESAVLWLEAE